MIMKLRKQLQILFLFHIALKYCSEIKKNSKKCSHAIYHSFFLKISLRRSLIKKNTFGNHI